MSEVFDPEKVTGHQPWLDAGIGDRIVTWEEWSELLALYRKSVHGDWREVDRQPRFVMTCDEVWDNEEQVFWVRKVYLKED